MTARIALRPMAGSIVRGGMKLLGKTGLGNRLMRNARFNVVGLEWRWGADEPFVSRGLVVERAIDGVPVRFFVIDENDHLQQHHMFGKWYEEDELKLMAGHFDGGTFVDIGANVGNHTLYAALVMKAAKVIAFEPNPPPFKACQYSILLNDLGSRVAVHNVGLSDVDEQAGIKWSGERNLGATQLETGAGTLVLKRGDDLLAGETPSLIKIDVEALEMKVLNGLKQTIARCRPILFVEVDHSNETAFRAYLDDAGYEILNTIPASGNTNYLCRFANLAK